MPEELQPDEVLPPEQAEARPSTELVLPERRSPVRLARQWPAVVVRARAQLMRLRENPAAMVAVSAAATVGSAVLTAGLRHALREESLAPARRTSVVGVSGYVVHEVHVVHHVVHHILGPTTDEHHAS
jgi:hypothetical protein